MTPSPLFIVEPRLWTPDGHHFDHAVSVARAAKVLDGRRRVVVLSGPQDAALSDALAKERAIDVSMACFQRRWIGDVSSFRYLLDAGVRDALALRSRLLEASSGRRDLVLFFSTLAIHELLILGVLRLTMPSARIRAFGVSRNDPLDADGRLTLNYRRVSTLPVVRTVWRAALRGTLVWTDSALLQRSIAAALRVSARLTQPPVPGVWELQDADGPAPDGLGRRPGAAVTVGFVGQPRPARCFDLFVMTALAMERERREGRVRFLAVVQPGAEEFWRMKKYGHVFRAGLPGMALEERWMSSTEFARQMARADIVWAVGEAGAYRRQTSGIFAHGLALGRNVITNRDSWAESVARDASGVAFVDQTVESAVRAVSSLLDAGAAPLPDGHPDRWRAAATKAMFDEFVGVSLRELAAR